VLTPRAPTPLAAAGAHPTAVMDQRGLAFVPHVLVIVAGTEVRFPNSDNVNHQVYSFSKPKTFQLPLYKGRSQAPVLFDRPGLVVLGCNIHDEMVGYIYVTETPYFGQTAADGTLTLRAIPDGAYRLNVWSPRIADAAEALTRELVVGANAPQAVEFRLSRPLRTEPTPRPRRPDWDY
jgi:plastocyanin